MTNPPGEGTPPERPDEPGPGEQQPGGQQPGASRPGEYPPGYWEQQAQQQGQPPYPQEPYQQPWQQPGYPPSGYPTQYPPDHPKATTSLVLGILGVVLCQVVAPFAWVMGKRTLDEIDASQGTVGGRGAAQAGYILGIVGTVLLGLGLIFAVIWIVFAIAIVGGGMNANY
jgi:hypothetical protein